MSFVEPVFLLLLGFTLAVYWTVQSARLRIDTLLAASIIFYGWWDSRFLLLLGFVIVTSWACALLASNHERGTSGRRAWTLVGCVTNLLVLVMFKYLGFFADSTATALSQLGLQPSWPVVHLIVPLGVSFFILQAISYLIDVSREDVGAERELRRVAFYIGFFPQLAAGPIVRAKHFLPQMNREKRLTQQLFMAGARAVLLGFIYKAGIADPLSQVADPVFGGGGVGPSDLAAWSNWALVGATVAFGGQVYFDFAGYSLMAVGVARWFGYLIPRNFDYPYASLSIDEFWRRWHMSLSAWLRDYVYIPLGGSQGTISTTLRNVMITVLLGALWHGAAWTFVAWGVLHGLALCLHRIVFRRGNQMLPGIVGLLSTQGFVLMAWVLFRAESPGDAITIWQAFAGLREGGTAGVSWTVWCVPLLVALDARLGRSQSTARGRRRLTRSPLVYWSGLGALTALAISFYPLEPLPFVYFQF